MTADARTLSWRWIRDDFRFLAVPLACPVSSRSCGRQFRRGRRHAPFLSSADGRCHPRCRQLHQHRGSGAGSLAAAWGYRRQLEGTRRWLILLTPPSIIGGVIGSLLVTSLDPKQFERLVPWLILTAAVLFLLQPILSRRIIAGSHTTIKPHAVVGVVVFQLLVAIYGGYFGAGIGILMLSSLGLMGMTDIHAMNGVKNFLAFCINGVAIIVFVVQGEVDWRCAAIMAPAAAFGALCRLAHGATARPAGGALGGHLHRLFFGGVLLLSKIVIPRIRIRLRARIPDGVMPQSVSVAASTAISWCSGLAHAIPISHAT